MPRLVCYYHEDSDGRCAAALVAHYVEKVTGKKINLNYFYEVNYTQEMPHINNIRQQDTVYLVDYSFDDKSLHNLYKLLGTKCNLIWIDHHKSSIQICKANKQLNKINGIRDTSLSGAALTYLYFEQLLNSDSEGKRTKIELTVSESTRTISREIIEKIPFYIQMVSDYDISSISSDKTTRLFNQGLEMFPENIKVEWWLDLHTRCKDTTQIEVENAIIDNLVLKNRPEIQPPYDGPKYLAMIINNGKNLDNYLLHKSDYIINRYGYTTTFEGYNTLVLNYKRDVSMFKSSLELYDILIIWIFDGDKYCYSIYSENPNIDCSKIAEKYGGGGHVFASGFVSDELIVRHT